METLKKRLSEQEKRHQGGNKWIGTAGTSPFGAYGYNPEGIRIGQDKSRHKKAIKVWDKREFKDLDDKSELGSRAMKIALKRLRQWARTGLQEEIDIDSTIILHTVIVPLIATANNKRIFFGKSDAAFI